MRQRIRPLLLFKKKSAYFQRWNRNTWALANRQQSTTLGTVRPVRGFSDGLDCATGNIIVIFSKTIVFTEGTGPNGVTITHDNGGTYTLDVTGATGSGTSTADYSGSWDVAPAMFNKITWAYSGGDYADEDGKPMSDATLHIRNCLNPTSNVTATAGWTGKKDCA